MVAPSAGAVVLVPFGVLKPSRFEQIIEAVVAILEASVNR